MPRGKVKWFDNRKGWGFVIQPDGTDLFVHYTSIVGDGFRRLDDGAEVEYELVEGPKGPQAGDVRVIGEPAPADDASADEAPAAEAPADDDDPDAATDIDADTGDVDAGETPVTE